ncbi:alpha/beta fold hydrolase [Longispora albida]|uniref:alpha/beta fold hydrolase n=1 Tax=Longispora albida TaxID=203523 RepID=UPI00037B0870|nr:alpha/beta fold hydrolase [Longispora albida]
MAASSLVKSTIVRTYRGAFWTLERTAPGLGSALAERLWCTVPRGRIKPAAAPGTRVPVQLHGRDLAVESWGSGPNVYLMHGWGGWRSQWEHFIAPLTEAGFRVIGLDAPSHGGSAPGGFGKRRGLLTEFAEALTRVVTVCGPAHALIGHSAGSSAVAAAVLDGLTADRLVMIAPMADPVPYSYGWGKALGFGEPIRAGFLQRLERRVGRPMADFNIPARAALASSLPPALVIHDRRDKQTLHTDGIAISDAWPDGKLVLTEGLGHQRILRDAGIVSTVVEYLS